MFALLKLLRYLIGEVAASPTSNTVLARLKALETLGSPASTLYDGDKDVSDKDTPEALAGSQAVLRGILVQAKEGNTGWVKVGNITSQNHRLEPLDGVVLPMDNLNKVYVDVEVDGEGVTYLAA